MAQFQWLTKEDLPLVRPAVIITRSFDDGDRCQSIEEAFDEVDDQIPEMSKSQGRSPSKKHVRSRTDSLPVDQLSPHSDLWDEGARMRRKSGDDVLVACSSTHKHAIFDAFRPRSKSDSKTKKPNIVSVLKNSVVKSKNSMLASVSPGSSRKNVYQTPPPSPLAQTTPSPASGSDSCESPSSGGKYEPLRRQRTGSECHSGLRGSPVAKVIDMFRGRSNSMSADSSVRKKLYGDKSSTNNSIQVPGASLLRRHSVDPERKRESSGPHRASLDENIESNTALLYRDAFGAPVTDPLFDKLQSTAEDEDMLYVKFFQHHPCYDLIPTSAKLVVFDSKLIVKKAFFALVQNGVRAAPLWNTDRQMITGMITVTDFMHMLQNYYKSPLVKMDELEEHKLELWKENNERGLVRISPHDSLFEALRTLIKERVHRLPIINPDTGNVLYILTHKRILKFLYLSFHDLPQPSFMNKSIEELKIGTYENIATAKPDTPIIIALNTFIEKRVSALPVIDDQGKVVDIYAKFDIINLAAERSYNNLDMTIKQALEHRNEWFEGVHNCKVQDSLASVLNKIVKAEVHRLVVVDDENKVKGVISLSDILSFLVFRNPGISVDDAEDTKKNKTKLTPNTKPKQDANSTNLTEEGAVDKNVTADTQS